MAKNDMIANHKRGLINSTVGNAFRGGLTGSLVFGGIAAIATIATGGLALPVIAGAAAAGAALFGGLNAMGGTLRWGAELVGGVLGMNRKQRGPQVNEFGEPQQAQAQGMGLAEGVVALVGAAMGMQSMKNKISGVFGSKDQDQPSQDFAPHGRGTQAQAHPGYAPQAPALLQDKLFQNEKGGSELRLTRDDMANPDIREAVQNYGRAQMAYRDSLRASGNPQARQDALEMQRTASFVDENGARDPSKMPGFNKETGTYILRPEHLMNPSVQKQMGDEGKSHQKDLALQERQNAKAYDRQMNDLMKSGRSKDEAFARLDEQGQQPAKPQSVEEAVAQRPATQATEAFGKNMADLANGAAPSPQPVQKPAQAPAAPQQPMANGQTASGLHVVTGKNTESAVQAARDALKAGVQHKGGADTARSGSATSQSRPTGQQIGN